MILLALLLSIDVALAGDELVIADKVIKIGDRTFGEERVITAIAVSPDGTKVAEVGGRAARRGRIAVWDIKSGKLLWETKAHRDLVYDVAWSPDGKKLYTAGGDKAVGVFDSDGKELDMLVGHAGAVMCVAVAPDGTLASGSSDMAIRIWKDGKSIRRMQKHSARVSSLAFRGDRLASGSKDGTVRIWQYAIGRQMRIIKGHRGEVLSVAWQGDKVVSGSSDGKVRLLDPKTAKIEKVIREHEDWVESVVVRGEKVVSADASGKIGK